MIPIILTTVHEHVHTSSGQLLKRTELLDDITHLFRYGLDERDIIEHLWLYDVETDIIFDYTNFTLYILSSFVNDSIF